MPDGVLHLITTEVQIIFKDKLFKTEKGGEFR